MTSPNQPRPESRGVFFHLLYAACGALSVACVAVAPLAAQSPCPIEPMTTGVLPGTRDVVSSLHVHNGVLGPRLLAGGNFALLGGAVATRFAAYDGTAWSAVGAVESTGPIFEVHAIATMPGGGVVIGGLFESVDGVAVDNIAYFDGVAWQPLGAGLSWSVDALLVLPNGDLVAGGTFTNSGGAPVAGIARWDGSSWQPLGGSASAAVHALALLPNGDLVAGGAFGAIGGQSISRIARWDGASWSGFGSGLQGGTVWSLLVTSAGELVVGGEFSQVDGIAAANIARWDGTGWSAMGTGSSRIVKAICERNGLIVAGGGFTGAAATSPPQAEVAAWDGASWTAFGLFDNGSAGSRVEACAVLPGGDLVAAGAFSAVNGVSAFGVARWDGATWAPLTRGFDARATAVAVDAQGRVAVGGDFSTAGPVAAEGAALLDGGVWSALGAGLGGVQIASLAETVTELRWLSNGDLIAGGPFASSGGTPANGLARWDGLAWTAFGGGLAYVSPLTAVQTIVELDGGRVLVGGAFSLPGITNLAVWDGVNWSALGAGSPNASVRAALVDQQGDVVVAGSFFSIGGVVASNVARWDGTAWSRLGAGVAVPMQQLVELPNGDLIAFPQNGGSPQRWDGSSWTQLPAPSGSAVGAVLALPDGSVLAAQAPWFGGGSFGGGGATGGSTSISSTLLHRFDGNAWSPVPVAIDGSVYDLALTPTGDVVVAGSFHSAMSLVPVGARIVSPCVLMLRSACPPSVMMQASGCVAASPQLDASLPWLGATWRATTTGLTNVSLGLSVSGFAGASLPLTNVFATAAPGCTLRVTPDFVLAGLATSGALEFSMVVPSNPALLGVSFRHQTVAIEISPSLTVTASDAAVLTIGRF